MLSEVLFGFVFFFFFKFPLTYFQIKEAGDWLTAPGTYSALSLTNETEHVS